MSAVVQIPCPRCGAPAGRGCAARDVRGRPAQHEERTARAGQLNWKAPEPSPGPGKSAKVKDPSGWSRKERREREAQQQRQAAERKERSRTKQTVNGRKSRRAQGDADRAYRRSLGIDQGEQMPRTLGAVSSAGAARGGRGASRKGRGQYS
ncbi:hypothetical protein ACIQU1_23340 [Streptomyces angustmyceticus]|uniref:zinc finger domain-containing protein n=1 Tax=Streptomyces angustmyceticus TaxID=285578 RepID=UPI00382A9D43